MTALEDKKWWRGGVIYQIYPRSFQDSDGDGLGDLRGITQRLDHIASLGVDAIWISPFFKSPMKDFGYDVSDYCDIDPLFGNLADFDAMIARAHELGLKIMIDLVLSHTSDQHPWFQASRQDCTNDMADAYVWADPKPDGTPPNNWLSIFGGSAWEWEPKRRQYYLHNFLTSQPDLNFHNVDVQDRLLDVARFWLDRGVDGFRLDTINFYFHDRQLRDNPALPVEQRNASIAPEVNPYNHQEHLYDKNQPENIAFLERLRALMDQYDDRAAVGEVGDAQIGLELVAQYTKGDKRVHMCYAFDFLSPEKLRADKTAQVLSLFKQKAPDGWQCWALSNHDVQRHASRLASGTLAAQEQRMQAAFLLSLPGSACVYQGEELGLREADVPFEALQDPYGITFWPEFKGRDGCRTPMVWSDAANAGFTVGDPWLPISAEHAAANVNVQEAQDDSLLKFYRDFIDLRRNTRALYDGDGTGFHADGDLLTIDRASADSRVRCIFNFSDAAQEVSLPDGANVLKSTYEWPAAPANDTTMLPPKSAWIVSLNEEAHV
ncbi:alpha-amylase family glycosyl hydrolase [Sulfitobacter sp. S190]|uniref:alpha-amylase family glycosyl hydrolase n=1 Tax=Sulfitobacter sp. S190 TaxID=2867022 RepID=UPI0021A4A8EC|nr:alpha-amylase family glycosyl hydrolase [Sulfitobacter sp. S190]UWR23917.1 DUF3459 domain-containing protein [Sulfitobacter sp. S190]